MPLSTHIEQVTIQAEDAALDGVLWLPNDPLAIVLLADGRAGHRGKPPIDYVGRMLRNARFGTLWLDLARNEEGTNQQAQTETNSLTKWLVAACDWLQSSDATRELPVGLFGAGIGGAAVLQLAAAHSKAVFAAVIRGAHADLAAHGNVGKVNVPTLLIVGSLDDAMVGVNRTVYATLRCKKRLEIIPGATHSFEEPGSLEVVAYLARGWFLENVRIK